MTIEALGIALSGLDAAKQALDITANNVSNAGVEGYNRKILPTYTAVSEDGTVFGVALGNVSRRMDLALRNTYWIQISETSSFSVKERYQSKVQLFHGSSNSGIAIPTLMDNLEESFIKLSSSPNDTTLQQDVVNSANILASKFNEFADFLADMRNEIQDEMSSDVDSINQLLETIAKLNRSIKYAISNNQSTAELEDSRDQAVSQLSSFLSVSHFTRDDGTLVVQTKGGSILAAETAQSLFFEPNLITPISPPRSIYINSSTGTDITNLDIGGSLGALIELRDQTVPSYQAQLDELAHKLALRFDAQGLRLFSDESGAIPGTTIGDYTNFSSEIQVNSAIVANSALVKDGTEASIVVGEASNAIISKILDYTFGSNEGVRVEGTNDLTTNPTVQLSLGIESLAIITGDQDVAALGDLTTHPDITAGNNFTIQLGGAAPQNVVISGGDTITELVAKIDTALGANGTAYEGANGRVIIEANDDITFALGGLSPAGFAALGFSVGTTPVEDPSFTVKLSTGAAQTITIPPTHSAADLINDLNNIPGLNASLNGSNGLLLLPEFGGDIQLTDGFGQPLAAMGLDFSNISHVTMNTAGLGTNGDIETNINPSNFITDYSRNIINKHSSDYNNASLSLELETDYQTTIQSSIQNRFGVDIDQEMAAIIEIQANYAAAARVVEASRQLFDELLNSF